MVISRVLIGIMMTRSVMELILSVQMLNNHEKPWGKNGIPKPDLKNVIFLAPDNQSLWFFLANIVISHVLIGFMMTRSPSMLIKGARLCQKEVLCTASIGVQYCGDMVARGPPKHQSNWNFLAFSEPAHQMEPKNA